MSEIIITFCGHSRMGNHSEIEDILRKKLIELITISPASHTIAFYCGGYGDFDSISEKVTGECQSLYPDRNIKRFYITPYIDESQKSRIDEMKSRFDDVIYPPLESVPKRFAISRRNEWMIDSADIVISGVQYDFGGAAKTLEYAKQKKKNIIELQERK